VLNLARARIALGETSSVSDRSAKSRNCGRKIAYYDNKTYRGIVYIAIAMLFQNRYKSSLTARNGKRDLRRHAGMA
jgi:hypothetical protein